MVRRVLVNKALRGYLGKRDGGLRSYIRNELRYTQKNLECCRAGKVDNHGWSLKVHVEELRRNYNYQDILTDLGMTEEQLQEYFLQDLRGMLELVRGLVGTEESLFWDLQHLQNELDKRERKRWVSYQDLGTSVEELMDLDKRFQHRR